MNATTNSERYFPAIDGLRALAVLSIVIYHIDSSLLPGGFVGVDVFFVISGFVVTYSVRSARFDNFSEYLSWFYRRRILRIYPVLLIFLLVGFFIWMMIVPEGYAGGDTFKTGISAFFGLSNIILQRNAGDYFGTLGEFNIFTHTWSLAVEEQFYLLFPLLSYFLIVNRRTTKSTRLRVDVLVLMLIAMSMVAAYALTLQNRVVAFYWIFTRFWELAIGFVLANCALRNRDAWSGCFRIPIIPQWLAAASLIALFSSFWLISAKTPFPFPGALVPCAATSILVLAAVQARTSTSKWLEHRTMVWIGKISFSLYLWHWLAIVLLRWTYGTLHSWQSTLILMAALLTMASLSYVAIERPLRQSSWLRSFSNFHFFSGFALILLCSVLLAWSTKELKPILSLASSSNEAVWSPFSTPPREPGDCAVDRLEKREPGIGKIISLVPKDCERQAPGVFVIGDSHAGAYFRSLYKIAALEGRRIEIMSQPGCRVIEGPHPWGSSSCEGFREAALARVSSLGRPGQVVFLPNLLIPRYRNYSDGDILSTGEVLASKPVRDISHVNQEASRLSPLLKAGLFVLLEAPKPVLVTAPFRCSDAYTRINPYCQQPAPERSDLELRKRSASDYLEAIRDHSDKIMILDLFPKLCPTARCEAWVNGMPLLNDTDHLSGFGNDLIRQKLQDSISQLNGRSIN
jgi:peptidoglycan/LPS O-acetylase OafA/YrhL